MSRRRRRVELFAGLIGLVGLQGPALAADPPAASSAGRAHAERQALAPPNAQNFRPTGPVTITADRAELQSGQSVLYTGHVTFVSNTVKMQGDRLELHQLAGRAYQARVTGAPAYLNHAGDGPENPPVAAHASALLYDSRSTEIELLGDAQFTRGDNQISADTIRYNVADRRAQAEGNGKAQVNMVITPPPPNSSTGDAGPSR